MAQKNKQLNKLTDQKLSIQISLSGLSFCILKTNENTITTLRDFKFGKKTNPFEALDRLKHLFDNEAFLQTSFDEILLIHENDLSTLVPKSYFNEDYLADYLKFNSKILKSDFIAHDTIAANTSVNVYVPYVNINNYIYEKFGEFTFKHFSTVLLENILEQEKANTGTKMYVHVSDLHFEIIVLEKEKLILYNTFEYKNAEDFIYYILFTAEQLELDPETFELFFLGAIRTGDALYSIAHEYIRHLNFGNRNDKYSYMEKPKDNHSYFAIINSF